MIEQTYENISVAIDEAINKLDVVERDRNIYRSYLSYDNSTITLIEFSKQWNLSTERVRQILNVLTNKLDKQNIRKLFNGVADEYKHTLFIDYFYLNKGYNYTVYLLKILYFKTEHLDRLIHEFKLVVNNLQ